MKRNQKIYGESDIEKILIEGLFHNNVDNSIELVRSIPKGKISSEGENLFNSFINTCKSINEYCDREWEKIMSHLDTNSSSTKNERILKKNSTRTFHIINIDVPSQKATEAIKLAQNEGYFAMVKLSNGAIKSLIKTHNSLKLIKMDNFTTRLVIHWENNDIHVNKITNLFRPTLLDYKVLKLPQILWLLYFPFKPLRLAFSRFSNLNYPYQSSYLGTPTSLIKSLLNFASITSGDYLVDFGCGDGRIVIEAIKTFGCKALGIEKDKSLYKQALENSKQFDLEDKLSIINTDFMDSSMTSATVIFLFLPVQLLQNFIPTIIKRLSKGTRIIAHEQQQMKIEPKPSLSKLLISNSAMTVAHLWVV